MHRSLPIRILVLILSLIPALPTLAGHGAEGAKLRSHDLVVGEGALAEQHAKVKVHYTGWLTDGTRFDTSLERGEAFEFQIGAGQVIPGWDMGVEGMRVGGKRELVVPPELGYGSRGAGEVIPPNATLKFEIELLEVIPPAYSNIGNRDVRNLLQQGVKLFDIRRQDEWKQTGVVEGSIQTTAFDNRGRFQQSFLDELARQVDKNEEFMIICRTGNRTAALANWLSTRGGYSKVHNVRDGITDWIDEGLPVQKN